MVDEAAARTAAEQVVEPDLLRPLGELGLLRRLTVAADGAVEIEVGAAFPTSPRDQMERSIQEAVAAAAPGTRAVVRFVDLDEAERAGLAERVRGGTERGIVIGGGPRPGRAIVVASGKGGVGKSSVTANLAVALAAAGHSVGVIDADVWGFSIPKMLGSDRNPQVLGDMLIPPRAHGVRVMSMDYFVQPDQAVVWRGPMLHKALEQFLGDVFWDDPEFLLLDMPPGTGDVAISVAQFLPRAQAIIVTTPQITAQRVAKRAALMAEKVDQEVLGVIENMSWFTGNDGTRYHPFGEGGGAALAEELNVPLLGRVPLLPAMREGADAGEPVAVAAPGSEAAAAFRTIGEQVVAMRPKVRTHPELVIR